MSYSYTDLLFITVVFQFLRPIAVALISTVLKVSTFTEMKAEILIPVCPCETSELKANKDCMVHLNLASKGDLPPAGDQNWGWLPWLLHWLPR